MKKIALLILLLTGIHAQAGLPENMPQSVYDDIVQTVIADVGYFDSVAVETAISQWLLSQPLATTDANLIASGDCTNCLADNTDADSRFKQPRKVKVKAKQRPNGKYPSVLKISWKKPKKLPASIRDEYELSHYKVFISKDNDSYEILEVLPKIKRNGKLKKKQSVRFKDRSTGSYQVQVQALYSPVSTSNSASKVTNPAIKAVSKGGSYTAPLGFTKYLDMQKVKHLNCSNHIA